MNLSRILIVALLTQAAGAAAQTPAPGDWPCKQVRVPDIAIGGVWSGPGIDSERQKWREDGAVADLVSRSL